jgi:hypothetical protein
MKLTTFELEVIKTALNAVMPDQKALIAKMWQMQLLAIAELQEEILATAKN